MYSVYTVLVCLFDSHFSESISKAGETIYKYLTIEQEKLTIFAPTNEAFLEMYRNRHSDYEALMQDDTVILEHVRMQS